MTFINATAEAMTDRLGEINAAIADMQAEAKGLKLFLQQAIAAGDAVEGDLFRAAHAVSHRSVTDWKSIAAKLKPSRQLVAAHTKSAETHSIRVSARRAAAA